MAKPLTVPAVLRAAIDLGLVPADALLLRRRGLRWQSGDLEFVVWISKNVTWVSGDPQDELSWIMHVGDAKFAASMDEFGRMSVPIRGFRDSIPWPSPTDPSLEDFLREGIGRAKDFMADRSDLAATFSSREDIVRGEIFAWLPSGNYPARLVQGLIIARDLEDADLATRILKALRSEPIPMRYGTSLNVMESARQWAKDYSKALGFKIPLSGAVHD